MAASRSIKVATPPLSASDRRAASSRTLLELLRVRATENAERNAYRFLPGEKRGEQRISYAELDERARALAVAIAERARKGDRALLLVPAGIDYIAAYFGCLYAGVIAVPAYPPNPRRPDARIPAIVEDCQPSVAITTAALRSRLEAWRGDSDRLASLAWISIDDVRSDAAQWQQPAVEPNDVAMLQYTSGSTATPKGVMLTHRNLMHNLSLIRAAFSVADAPDDVGVFWLPPFHDMGLIGGILEPCYLGRSVVKRCRNTRCPRARRRTSRSTCASIASSRKRHAAST
jgi:acyl-CoA synthetase (AMP-forming)/AMP-acid ligase II